MRLGFAGRDGACRVNVECQPYPERERIQTTLQRPINVLWQPAGACAKPPRARTFLRNETKRNESKRNETKRNETERNIIMTQFA
jgi:hypothetical protein